MWVINNRIPPACVRVPEHARGIYWNSCSFCSVFSLAQHDATQYIQGVQGISASERTRKKVCSDMLTKNNFNFFTDFFTQTYKKCPMYIEGKIIVSIWLLIKCLPNGIFDFAAVYFMGNLILLSVYFSGCSQRFQNLCKRWNESVWTCLNSFEYVWIDVWMFE